MDVADFVEAEEVGKEFRSSDRRGEVNDGKPFIDADVEDDDEESGEETPSSSPEVWGEDAWIAVDYEGRSAAVDGPPRTVVEYKGCDDNVVRAYAVGSLRVGQQQERRDDD